VNILSAHPVAPWNVIFGCSLCIPEQDSSLRLPPVGRPALSRALCLIPDLQQSVYSALSETCGGKQPMWQRFTSTGMSAFHSASLWLCPWRGNERQDKHKDFLNAFIAAFFVTLQFSIADDNSYRHNYDYRYWYKTNLYKIYKVHLFYLKKMY